MGVHTVCVWLESWCDLKCCCRPSVRRVDVAAAAAAKPSVVVVVFPSPISVGVVVPTGAATAAAVIHDAKTFFPPTSKKPPHGDNAYFHPSIEAIRGRPPRSQLPTVERRSQGISRRILHSEI